ncbi:MAG: SDR family NAD(P)-dependent oxidoreductase [Anaerolineae bacterium]|nr:SDR family NAD(P)-dependent oxidoreductase [Anaerolineae bacterium]
MTAVVLITGASSGIGRAAALAFARAGYQVAGVARRMDRLALLAQEIAQLPAPHGDFLPLTADVTDPETIYTAVQHTLERFGRLDVLIASAGIGQRGALVEAAWSDVDMVLQTNIDGVLHSIRAAVPAMRLRGDGGHILIISSVAASLVAPYAATYAASKAFISSIAHSLRLELAPHHIHVTDVLVGRTETEFNARRLGEGERRASRLPAMSAEQVATGLLKAARQRRSTVILRFFDRLIVLGNRLLPGLMGELAKRQYR